MAKTYGLDLSSVTAGTVVPLECRDHDVYGYYTDNTWNGGSPGSFVVPASPYKAVLQYVPIRGTLSITLNSVTAALIEWPGIPASTGIVSVDYLSGRLRFYSGDAAKAVVGTYRHEGSAMMAYDWMLMMKNMAAIQASVVNAAKIVSSLTGLNAKATGTPSMSAIVKNCIVTARAIISTAAVSITSGPVVGIGIASGENDIFLEETLGQLTGADAAHSCDIEPFTKTGRGYLLAGDVPKVGLDTVSVGTSQTIAVYIIGVEI